MHSLVGGGEADGSYSRGFLYSSPPSINTTLPIRRLNFVILFVSFRQSSPCSVSFFVWGGGVKSKIHLLPLEMEYNIVKNFFVKNNVVYQKSSKYSAYVLSFLLHNAVEYIALSLYI